MTMLATNSTIARKRQLLLAALIAVTAPALAWADNRTSCTKFADHSVNFYNGGFNDYYAAVQEAIFDLPASMHPLTVVDFNQVGGYGENDQANVIVADFGSGMPTAWADVGGVYNSCIISFGLANINTHYANAASYEDKRWLAAHENGHLHGFQHTGDGNSPMHANRYGTGIFAFTGYEQGHLWDAYCPSCSTVSLRVAANWKFVAAENAGGTVLNANRDSIGPWEQFKLHNRGGGWYTLQALDGRFVSAIGAGGGYVLADKSMIGHWEEFQAVPLGGNAYGIRTYTGHYLTAGWNTPLVTAVAGAIGGWETFYLY
jgi:hypothetical protein